MTPFWKMASAGVAAVLVLTGFALSRWNPWGATAAPAKPSGIAWRQGAPTTTVTDSEEIFKRAFWRLPGNGDEVLHAERHEWSNAEGLQRWQWFLVVSASPSLIRYLREENAFGLVTSTSAPLISEAPSWFRFNPEDVTTMRAPQASMELMFSKKDQILYATASGRGFTKGAPEPAKPAQPLSATGRLPTTPPPILKP